MTHSVEEAQVHYCNPDPKGCTLHNSIHTTAEAKPQEQKTDPWLPGDWDGEMALL